MAVIDVKIKGGFPRSYLIWFFRLPFGAHALIMPKSSAVAGRAFWPQRDLTLGCCFWYNLSLDGQRVNNGRDYYKFCQFAVQRHITAGFLTKYFFIGRAGIIS